METQQLFFGEESLQRVDNISDTALRVFREHYHDDSITKDDIFDYVYGILHSQVYRDKFANDLSKMIPRIPFAPDFRTFVEAGVKLADLHLNYETCARYPGIEVQPLTPTSDWVEEPAYFRLGTRAMRFADKNTRDTLIINEYVKLTGIPEEAHRYIVNGRTPLEWFIYAYRIKRDKESGIVNDPNEWFEKPRDLVTAIERIVHVSVESAKIVEELPSDIGGAPQGITTENIFISAQEDHTPALRKKPKCCVRGCESTHIQEHRIKHDSDIGFAKKLTYIVRICEPCREALAGKPTIQTYWQCGTLAFVNELWSADLDETN